MMLVIVKPATVAIRSSFTVVSSAFLMGSAKTCAPGSIRVSVGGKGMAVSPSVV